MRHYERHASEQHGRCLNPYMDALTRLEIVEDTEARLVVDARYFYRDRFMDGGDGMGVDCAGFSERRFTLTRAGNDLRVIEMSATARR